MSYEAYRMNVRIQLRLCRAGRKGNAFGPADAAVHAKAQRALVHLRSLRPA